MSGTPSTPLDVRGTPIQSKLQPPKEIDIDIAKLVQKKTVSTSPSKKVNSDEPLMLHIWDFAGQDLYYTTHQVSRVYICLFSWVLAVSSRGEGGGGTSIIEGGRDVTLDRAWYSFYHRVASQPTMFMTGPWSLHQRRQSCHSKFSFSPTPHGHFPILFPYANRPYERLKPPAVGGFPYESQPWATVRADDADFEFSISFYCKTTIRQGIRGVQYCNRVCIWTFSVRYCDRVYFLCAEWFETGSGFDLTPGVSYSHVFFFSSSSSSSPPLLLLLLLFLLLFFFFCFFVLFFSFSSLFLLFIFLFILLFSFFSSSPPPSFPCYPYSTSSSFVFFFFLFPISLYS